MSLPTVACVMLTRDRPEMSRRAVRCFVGQTYPADHRQLFIYDTGDEPQWMTDGLAWPHNVIRLWARDKQGQPIGKLRNLANEWAACGLVGSIGKPDILMHWDSDDWSAPGRIADQVVALTANTSSRAQFTGYHTMLFWDSTPGKSHGAWVYHGAPNYAVGTSLAYRREAWERQPFTEVSTGEDTEFIRRLRGRCYTGIPTIGPHMIGAIHDSNTTCRIVWEIDRKTGELRSHEQWERVPRRDKYAEVIMAL